MIFDENFDLDDGEVEVFFEDDEHYIYFDNGIINETSIGYILKSKTKLPFNIYISTMQGNHGGVSEIDGRVKIQNNYNIKKQFDTHDTNFSLLISKTPSIVAGNTGSLSRKDLIISYAFVSVNCNILSDIWCSNGLRGSGLSEEDWFDSLFSKLIIDPDVLLRMCPEAQPPEYINYKKKNKFKK